MPIVNHARSIYSQRTVKVLEIEGILDGTRLLEIQENVEALQIAAADVLLVDLSAVEFMDSSGLSALIMTLKYVRSRAADLVLCAPDASVQLVLDLTSTAQFFPTFSSRAVFEVERHLGV